MYRVIWKVIQSFQFLISQWDLTLVSMPQKGPIIPASQVLRYWGNLKKLGRNTQNHVQEHMKSNPKSLQHLVSHQVRSHSSKIALCGLSCICFPGTWVLWQFGETGPKYPQLMSRVQTKSNSRTSAPYFTSNKSLL